MMAESTRITLRTEKHWEWVDITHQVQAWLDTGPGRHADWVHVYCPHTTAGIAINEGADPDVVGDVLGWFERAIPWDDPRYQHAEGNTAAHIAAILVGTSQWVPVEGGRLALGRWQSIYFCEFDGPRHRQVVLKTKRGT